MNVPSAESLKSKRTQFQLENGIYYYEGWAVEPEDRDAEKLTIKEGTVGIARYAFEEMYSLKTVYLPNSLQYIGSYAFVDCPEIIDFVIPLSVTYVGEFILNTEVCDTDDDLIYYNSNWVISSNHEFLIIFMICVIMIQRLNVWEK